MPLTDLSGSSGSGASPLVRETVASAARIRASQIRRKAGRGRFMCSLCAQNFTTRTNLKSKPSSADVVAMSLSIYSRPYQCSLRH